MPDSEISKLPPLTAAQLQAEDVLAVADVSVAETKKIRADDLVVAGLSAVTPNSIDPNILDWSQLNSDSISGDDLADESIADAKLIANTLTARSIAPGAIGSSELAAGAVDTAALQVGAVDNGALSTNSVNNRVIEDEGVSTDNLAGASVTLNKLGINDGELNGSLITDDTIGENQLTPDLPSSILAAGSITSVQISDFSITSNSLAIDSVTTNAVVDAAITDEKIASLNGAKIIDGTVAASKFNPGAFARGLSNNGTDVGIANAVPAAVGSGISWNAQGLITGFTPLQGTDLPVATDSAIGGVSVPADSGLAVRDLGEVSINNSILAGTTSGITYDAKGLITSTALLASTDLPPATTTQLGAVSVPTSNNNPLTINAAGELRLGESAFAATDGLVSVDVDEFGLVAGGSTVLVAAQIPALDAGQITTGEFPTERLSNDSVLAEKIADYATCLMQETSPGAGDFLGQLWYTPSTAQLRVYSRGSGPQNIWLPVGFGSLQANNLRWGGTFNADTDKVSTVTSIGTSEGLIADTAFPAPSDELSGLYLLCQVAGSNCTQNNIQSQTFTSGDWALCLDATQGWLFIDANGGGGGGGGGAQYLNDLLDVNIGGPGGPFNTAPQMSLEPKQLLKYDGGDGMWKNTNLLDGGTF